MDDSVDETEPDQFRGVAMQIDRGRQRRPEQRHRSGDEEYRAVGQNNIVKRKSDHHPGQQRHRRVFQQCEQHEPAPRVAPVEIAEDETVHLEIFTNVAPLPAQEHPADALVGFRHIGVEKSAALQRNPLPGPQHQIGECAVLADPGRTAHELLVPPLIEQRQNRLPPIGAQSAGRTEHAAPDALPGANEVKSEGESRIDHRRERTAVGIRHPDIAGNRPDPAVADDRRNHLGEGVGLHLRIAVDGDKHITAAHPESAVESEPLASVLLEVHHPDPPRKLLRRAVDPQQRVIDAAVIDGDDFEFVRGVIGAADAGERFKHVLPLVIRRHDDGTARQLLRRQHRRFTVEDIAPDGDQRKVGERPDEEHQRGQQRNTAAPLFP